METLSYHRSEQQFGVHPSMTATIMGIMEDNSSDTMTDLKDYGGMDSDMHGMMGQNGSKSSRRKQSKPIRVYDFVADPDIMAMETENAEVPSRGDVAGDGVPEESARMNEGNTEKDMDVNSGSLSCDLCNDTFDTQSQLDEHVVRQHSLDMASMDNFPTKYHQLGSEFQEAALCTVIQPESTDDKPESETMQDNDEQQPTPAPEFSVPSPSQEAANDREGQSSPSSTSSKSGRSIFHANAYCKMCDREFCNKYFLKTHMANKHGIYENGDSNSPGLNLSQNGLPTMVPLPKDMTPAASLHQSLSASLSNHKSLSSLSSISSSMPSLTSGPRDRDLTQSPASSGPTNLPGSPPAMKSSDHQRPPLPAQQKPRMPTPTTPSRMGNGNPSNKSGGNMEDYCEICQKHFCNKYYLKKHKQDVHGIIPDTPTQKRSRSNASSSSSNSGTTNTMSSANALSNGMPNMNAMANVMFLNPFAPPMMLQNQQMLQALPGGFLPQSLPFPPPIPASEPGQNPPSGSGADSHMSKGPSRNGSGSGGADTYCELCRKEFCNSYFLRIHKANKHGIFLPEDPSEQGIPPFMMPMTMDGLPLPFLMGNGQKEPGQREKSLSEKEEKRQIEDDIEDGLCKHCNKTFPNRYMLHVHQIQVHEITPPDLKPDEMLGLKPPAIPMEEQAMANLKAHMALEGMHASNMAEHSPGGSMFGNMIAAKLADRVVCDICNKEVCNKYFLKTHKLKVHGIDPGQSDSEKSSDSSQRPPQEVPTDLSKKTSPQAGTTPIQKERRPNDEELLKMGIDPEAYCEICKKEFCSKYFLRTHKQNIHGIVTEVSSQQRGGSSQKGYSPNSHSLSSLLHASPMAHSMPHATHSMVMPPHSMPSHHSPSMQHHSPSMSHQSPPLPHQSPPLSHQSSPMSHASPPMSRQSPPSSHHSPLTSHHSPPNMSQHSPPSSSHPSMLHPPPLSHSSQSPMGPLVPTSLSLPPSMGAGSLPLSSLPPDCRLPLPGTAGLPFFPPSMVPHPNLPEMNERRTWKWKEPINATRVMCEFCNKELCNKYFLKTHMLNKHNMYYDHITGQTSPMPPKKDGEASPKKSSFKSEPNMGSDSNSSGFGDPAYKESVIKSTMNAINSMNSSDKPFFNMNLNLGVPPNHEQKPPADGTSIKTEDGSPNGTVSAKTWHVPELFKQEPDKSENEEPPKMMNGSLDSLSTESFIQKCDMCGLLFGDQVTLSLHKMRDHGQPGPMDLEAAMEPRPSLTTSIGLSLRKKYQKQKLRTTRRWRRIGQCSASIGDKVKSAIVNHIQNHQKRKKYRCAHCQERFISRALCHAHIRADHPNIRLGTDSSQDGERSNSVPRSSPIRAKSKERSPSRAPVTFAQPRKDSNDESSKLNYTMQPFTLEADKPDASNFATSVVYLPVFEKVGEPITVTFNLRPTEP